MMSLTLRDNGTDFLQVSPVVISKAFKIKGSQTAGLPCFVAPDNLTETAFTNIVNCNFSSGHTVRVSLERKNGW